MTDIKLIDSEHGDLGIVKIEPKHLSLILMVGEFKSQLVVDSIQDAANFASLLYEACVNVKNYDDVEVYLTLGTKSEPFGEILFAPHLDHDTTQEKPAT